MSDSRLNSVHLPPPRRDQFRAARASLFNASGDATMAGDQSDISALPHNQTAIHADAVKENRFPPGVQFVLVDNDFVYPLKSGINTVGRMPDNDVVVADPYVSRRHIAIVVHVEGGCEVHDIASKNGTFLNGQTIKGPTPLNSGDHLRLSDHLLIFLRNDSESEPQRKPDQTLAE